MSRYPQSPLWHEHRVFGNGVKYMWLVRVQSLMVADALVDEIHRLGGVACRTLVPGTGGKHDVWLSTLHRVTEPLRKTYWILRILLAVVRDIGRESPESREVEQ